MFQWVFLQIKQLLDLDLEEDILDALGKLPQDLKHAYDEIYNAMTKVEKRIADRAFQWVMCACKPLDTYELLPAIAQDPSIDVLKPLGGLTEDLVLKYCHNLLVIDPVRHVWVPSHLSVLEYFEDHLWTQTQANYLVANVCLGVLQNSTLYDRESWWHVLESKNSFKGFSSNISSTEQRLNLIDPLHQGQGFGNLSCYARHHWSIHASRSSGIDNKDQLSARLTNFLGLPTKSSAAYQCWHRMIDSEEQYQPSTSVFYINIRHKDIVPASISSFAYCAFGLALFLPDWHNLNWTQEDQRTETGLIFLELAVMSGSAFTCRCLVENGADPNLQSESQYGSALAAAASHGEKEIVEFLVEREGAEVNMQLEHGEYGSALAAAVCHGEREIAEFLVEKGAEVNMQLECGGYGSALAVATYSGEREIVKFLVERGGAEVNMRLEHGRYGSALAVAAYFGEADIVELLLNEGGADVNLQLLHGKYRSALDAADGGGDQEVIDLLLKHGAKREQQQSRVVDETEISESEDGYEDEVESDESTEETGVELKKENTEANECDFEENKGAWVDRESGLVAGIHVEKTTEGEAGREQHTGEYA